MEKNMVGKWVSVHEREPDKDKEHFVLVNGKPSFAAWSFDEGWRYEDGSLGLNDGVVYWLEILEYPPVPKKTVTKQVNFVARRELEAKLRSEIPGDATNICVLFDREIAEDEDKPAFLRKVMD